MTSPSPRDLVRTAAERHGDRVAVVSGGEPLTYRRLAERTAALAAALKSCGVGAGVQVGIMFPNSAEFLVWYFAVAEAGGIVVSLSPTITPGEAGKLMARGEVSFLAAPEAQSLPDDLEMSRVADLGLVEGGLLWRAARDYPPLATIPWTEDGFMARQFSSGSTGEPKHMLKTEANIFHNYWHFCETHGFVDAETLLGAAPFYHAFGNMSFQAAFYLGGTIIVLPKFLPAEVLTATRTHQPTVFLATFAMIDVLGNCLLHDGDEQAFRSLKLCISGTGNLSKSAYERFQNRFGVSVCSRYGTTESLSATVDLDDGYEEGRAGRPYAGVEIGIFDDDGNPLPVGAKGKIGVRGPATCAGYVGDPESTARSFQDGYAFAGDLGYLDDTGCLYVMGRADVINIGGNKVDPIEVEKVIRESLPVKDVVVLAGERAGLSVVRAVIEADPAKVTRAMVIEVCRARLSPYKVPALVEVSERLERDANGKVLRAAIGD